MAQGEKVTVNVKTGEITRETINFIPEPRTISKVVELNKLVSVLVAKGIINKSEVEIEI